MILDHRYHQLGSVRGYLSRAVYPIQWTIDVPFRVKDFVWDFARTHYRLVIENQTIKEQQLVQDGRLQRLSALEAENNYLRALLQTAPRKGDVLKGAEIIQVDPDPFNHRIFLNKGKQDGVFVGQPIIDAKGVVGEVIEVFESNSRALLVTDASHAVPVENLRNGVRGILVGIGALDSMQLQYVPTTADIQVGDVLLTSGLGGRFPPGYPVAVVSNVSRDAGESFAVIRAVPKAELDRGRQVLLVQNNQIVSEQQTLPDNQPSQEMQEIQEIPKLEVNQKSLEKQNIQQNIQSNIQQENKKPETSKFEESINSIKNRIAEALGTTKTNIEKRTNVKKEARR